MVDDFNLQHLMLDGPILQVPQTKDVWLLVLRTHRHGPDEFLGIFTDLQLVYAKYHLIWEKYSENDKQAYH